MYMEASKFYYKFGITKVSDFVTPKIMDLNTIVLPYYSSLHFANPDSDILPNKDTCRLLTFVKEKDAMIYFPIEYRDPKFEIRHKNVSELRVIKEIIKEYKYVDFPVLPSFKFFKYIKRHANDLKLKIPVISYNFINKYYMDLPDPYKNLYYKYYNSYRTLFKNVKEVFTLSKQGRIKYPLHSFIVVDLPDLLYKVQFYLDHLDKPLSDRNILKKIYEYEHMFLFDLIKSLSKKHYEETVLSTILTDTSAEKLLKNITLIIRHGRKGVFLNLYYLYTIDSDITIGNEDITKYLHINRKLDYKTIIKLFYVMLKTMYTTKPFTPEEIEKNRHIEIIAKERGYDIDAIDKLNYAAIDAGNRIDEKEDTKKEESEEKKEETKELKKSLDKIVEKELEEDEDELNVVEIEEYRNRYTKIKDIEELKNHKPDVVTEAKEILNELYENKQIDTAKYKKLTKLLEETLKKKNPLNPKETIKDSLNIKKEDIEIKDEEAKIIIKPKIVAETTKDNSVDKDTNRAKIDKYLKNVYHKDLTQAILAIQRGGLIVKDIRVNEHEDILGKYQEIEIDVNDMGKSNYTLKIKIPVVNPETGEYKISGNSYVLRQQRADVPIKKIAFNKVSLASAYGKEFVYKAPVKSQDEGFSIKKQLKALEEAGIVKNVVSGTIKTYDLHLPTTYAKIARYVKSFLYKGNKFSFNYSKRHELLEGTNLKLEEVENKGKYVLIGITKDKQPIVSDFNNCLYIYKNKKYAPINGNGCTDILDYVGVDRSKIKKEFSTVQVLKTYVPVAFMLTFYMGLYNLLNKLKVKYEVLEGKKNIKEDENTIVIKFAFNTLVIHIDNELQSMILEGLKQFKKQFSKIDINILNNKDATKAFMNTLGYNLATVTKIEIMETLFIDPITRNVLEHMGEPTTFPGLLIRASEMLLDDYYIHPNDMRGYMLKGYERMAQMVYNNLVEAIEKKKSEEYFGRSRLHVDPYKVWRMINEA